MDNTVLRVILIVSTLLIVGLLSELLKRLSVPKSNAGTKSLKSFVVSCPHSYFNGLSALTWVLMGVFALIYIVAIYNANYWNTSVYIAFVAVGILLLLLNYVIVGPALIVEKSTIAYRSSLHFFQSFTFSDIKKVEYDDDDIYIYRGDKSPLKIDAKFYCAINFLRRCEKEGIAVAGRDMGVLTKRILLREASKRGSKTGVAIGFIFAVLIAVPALANRAYSSVLIGLIIAFIFGLVVALGLSWRAFWGLWALGTQEKELGFSFDEEMSKYNIRTAPHMDANWFIDISSSNIVVLRRDYIATFGHIDEEAPERQTSCDFISKANEYHKIRGNKAVLQALELWYQKKK